MHRAKIINHLVVLKINGRREYFLRLKIISLYGRIGIALEPNPWPKRHEFINLDKRLHGHDDYAFNFLKYLWE